MDPILRSANKTGRAGKTVGIRVSPERWAWFRARGVNITQTVNALLDKEFPISRSQQKRFTIQTRGKA